MADLALSDLTAITTINSTDLIYVSQDIGGGAFSSVKITAADFGPEILNGVRNYGASATDPVSPTPQDGDEYYNTVLNMKMYYDGSRLKWLSIESDMIPFGRNANTGQGIYYLTLDSMSLSAVDGRIAAYNGTVIGLGYTRRDVDSATFEITSGGTTIASLASTALKGKTNALSADFNADAILAVRNAAGGNTVTGVQGWVRVKWRI
jgi:hypothetical protein